MIASFLDRGEEHGLQRFLIVDVGSTTTKALLVQLVDGEWRLTLRGEAATTVEAPHEDVMIGVRRAVEVIERLDGQQLLGPAGVLDERTSFLATSSAGGGLQVLVCGLSKSVTAESAGKAALGAGAILMDVIATDDGRSLLAHLEALRQAKPDMVLLAGGIDSAQNVDFIAEYCDLLNSASPQPRFGAGYSLPVIYAGCPNGRSLAEDTLSTQFDLHLIENIRPSFDQENLEPARKAIHELFLSHVMAQAPGYAALQESVNAPILPTPVAVGRIMTLLAQRDGIDILGADIGGATTDVFSVIDGTFNRTVSANLGMSYSAGNVLVSAGSRNIRRWLPFAIDETELADEILDKLIYPTTVPATIRDLLIEQALAREALRLSAIHHSSLIKSLPRQHSQLQQAFRSQGSNTALRKQRQELLDMFSVQLLVGSGGVLSHAPRRAQAVAMLLDAFQPQGYTFLAVDSIFMMPHLGVLSQLQPEIALQVLVRDCFIPLGPSWSLSGNKRLEQLGQPALHYRTEIGGVGSSGSVRLGELVVLPLGTDETCDLYLEPVGSFDLGAGPGRAVSKSVSGGAVGVILDARGRDWVGLSESAAQMLVVQSLLALNAFTAEELQQAGGEVLVSTVN